jgi:hypothetical protein
VLVALAQEFPLTHQIVKELSSVHVPANHWLQTLIDVQLAIAKAGAGETDDALALLQSSLVVSGRYDHPLTSLALLEIGQIALEKHDLSLAQQSSSLKPAFRLPFFVMRMRLFRQMPWRKP